MEGEFLGKLSPKEGLEVCRERERFPADRRGFEAD
jgi:hypothetical protein